MRIVFMGTPQFAADILEELVHAQDVVAVYTRPDAVRGRGKDLVASPVKEVALKHGIEVLTPRSLKDAEAQMELAAFEPDAICVAAYGAILPKAVLDIPRFGCLNVHASLLPRWRGAAPIERAILEGDEAVGVCIMRMEEGLDTGDYCVSRSIPVAGQTAEALTGELASLGASALLTALAQIEAGGEHWVAQDESLVTYAHKIEKGELDLDPACSAEVNVRRVLASSDAHPARATVCERVCTVLDARLPQDEPEDAAAPSVGQGKVLFAGKRLYLGCADGALEVTEIKPQGKRAMRAADFAAGVQNMRSGECGWGVVGATA